MKKASIQKLVAVLSMVLLLGVITPKASAASYPVPLYTVLANVSATLSISSTGMATCSGSAKTFDSDYVIELSMDLIKYDQDETIKSWSTSGKTSVSLSKKNWYVAKGHDYQVVVTAKVYDTNNRLVETASAESGIFSY